MRITRAIVPAAGRGTRMRPFTLAVPKELVPVGSVPAIHRVVAEAARAGLTEVAVVLSPAKELLRRYLEAAQAAGAFPAVRLTYLYQEEPTGLADAMVLCRDFTRGEAFALLLPDNLPLSPAYEPRAALELAETSGRDVLGVIEVGPEGSGRYGNCGRIDYERLEPGVLSIRRLHGKGPGTLRVPPGTTLLRTCGRTVCQPHVFDYIERVRPAAEGELSEVPAFQEMVREAGVLGRLIPGPLFDVGNPGGLLAASAHLLDHPEADRAAGHPPS